MIDTQNIPSNTLSENVQEKENNETFSKVEEIITNTESPFAIIRTNRNEIENCFIAIGNKRISGFLTYGQCTQRIATRDYDLIVHLIMHMTEFTINQTKQ